MKYLPEFILANELILNATFFVSVVAVQPGTERLPIHF